MVTDTPNPATLPYGPLLSRLLRPMQRGFLYLNRWFMGPALRSPFGRLIGNPFTAYILLLRTRGRRTGAMREAPLGYVIRDGFAYCVAGYGVRTPWYLNLLDNPTVEVVLPGRTIRAVAEPVTDEAEWLRTYRALIGSFGLVGRLVDGDPRRSGRRGRCWRRIARCRWSASGHSTRRADRRGHLGPGWPWLAGRLGSVAGRAQPGAVAVAPALTGAGAARTSAITRSSGVVAPTASSSRARSSPSRWIARSTGSGRWSTLTGASITPFSRTSS